MEFSKQFIEIMDAVGKRLGIAIDWTNKNVVPYLTELSHKIVNYEIATSCVWFLVGLIATIIIIKLGKKIIKMDVEANKNGKADEDLVAILATVGFFLLVLPVWIMIQQTFDIVQALTLPEKTILEFISHLDIPRLR